MTKSFGLLKKGWLNCLVWKCLASTNSLAGRQPHGKAECGLLQFGCHYCRRLRVNSDQATQFRIWATKTLRKFIIKGFVLEKEIKEPERICFHIP
ncbi:MAG: virulence RhuM family protein [Chitinophagaceae bacterium]|nr:virulence RhuM family protein [Chitinophagaceae bacterium]